MESRNEHIVVADAAALLAVNHQRVRALLASGDLRGQRVGKIWLIDPQSLADYRHARQPSAGRALAPTTAWAALLTAFASETTDELVTAFRIVDERRARLLALRTREVDDWRWLARRRAIVNRYSTRPAYLTRLRNEDDTVPAGLSAGQDLELTAGSDVFDAYVDHTTADRLEERYRLRPDAGGNVTLRAINLTDSQQLAAIREPLPEPVIAVDLWEDRDPRAAAAGRNLLTDLIRQAQVAGR